MEQNFQFTLKKHIFVPGNLICIAGLDSFINVNRKSDNMMEK